MKVFCQQSDGVDLPLGKTCLTLPGEMVFFCRQKNNRYKYLDIVIFEILIQQCFNVTHFWVQES